jgi:hypothetical protein
MLSKNSAFNFSNLKEKLSQEKFSFPQVEEMINELIKKDFRDIQKLPKEFHQFSEILITLEKPTEPDDYECCGKGCNPCCWDTYDTKCRKYEETIKNLHEKVNED